MSKDTAPSPASLLIARRLLAREMASGHEQKPEIVGAGLQRTFVRVSGNLRDSMGEDGYHALLARALARTEAEHPVLKDLRGLSAGGAHLDGVAASVAAHGVAAVTQAMEGLLAALIDVLGRLIGDDMAIRILDDSPQESHRDGATS